MRAATTPAHSAMHVRQAHDSSANSNRLYQRLSAAITENEGLRRRITELEAEVCALKVSRQVAEREDRNDAESDGEGGEACEGVVRERHNVGDGGRIGRLTTRTAERRRGRFGNFRGRDVEEVKVEKKDKGGIAGEVGVDGEGTENSRLDETLKVTGVEKKEKDKVEENEERKEKAGRELVESKVESTEGTLKGWQEAKRLDQAAEAVTQEQIEKGNWWHRNAKAEEGAAAAIAAVEEEQRQLAAPGLWEENSEAKLTWQDADEEREVEVQRGDEGEGGRGEDVERVGSGGHISVVRALEREKGGLEWELKQVMAERERLRRQVVDVQERMGGLRERTRRAYEGLEREKRGTEREILEVRNENVRLHAEVERLRAREGRVMGMLEEVRKAVEERVQILVGEGGAERESGEDVDVRGKREEEGERVRLREMERENGRLREVEMENARLREMGGENERLRARAAFLQKENGRMYKEMREMDKGEKMEEGGGRRQEKNVAERTRREDGGGGGGGGGGDDIEGQLKKEADVVVHREHKPMAQVCVVTFGGW